MSHSSTRNHNGYLQIRNGFEVPDGKGGFKTVWRWQYVVNGFSYDDTQANLALWDGGEVGSPIDKQNRIKVRTAPLQYRKVGPAYWYH